LGYGLENWDSIADKYGGFNVATAFGSEQRLNTLLINAHGGKEFKLENNY